ncbi:hypothetical protein Pint_16312 [Pistacia integerrima]|uniref:Uncharacterized protein n=1 Tax=Pistacia integerrima TaxID=434235 RepID=A0ACC0Z7V3_9ROSI|nr:hypothetical protein Pint_16312 [Pistacia integerrima]
MQELRDLHYPLLFQWFQSHQSPPVAIISDFLLGWTHQLASEVGVARIVFSPTGAFGLSTFFTLWKDQPKIDDPNNSNSLLQFPNLPLCSSLRGYEIPEIYRTTRPGEPGWKFIRNVSLADMASWGIILNTSTHLDGIYIEHLKNQVGHNRVWAVGPLMLPKDDDTAGDLMTWLDAREDGSVVYVCFGSRGMLTKKQTNELAAGLEKSGVNFIWCVKLQNEKHVARDCGDIPEGFEGRVAGRGYIIKGWVPQVEIMRHRAVGVFLTHCGWNSTLEGIAGGVGMRAGEGTRNIPESTELAQLLIESLDETRAERVKAKELRDAVVGGVEKGGCSDKDLDAFVNCLIEIKP